MLAAGLLFWFVVIPVPWGLGRWNPERTALMDQRIAEARASGDSLVILQEWKPLDEIAPGMVRAVIVAEDHRFREHRGIDWGSLAEEVEWSGDDDFSLFSAADLGALAEAARYVSTHRGELRGRSTITQQLAKNLYFGTDRSLSRKAMEFVVARRLERRLDKDRILELYLNIVELGPGIFGVEAAAQHYFGRSAANLTLAQAAALAGTLPHPLTSNPGQNPGRMAWRRDLILERLDPSRRAPPGPIPLPDIAVDLPPPEPMVTDTAAPPGDSVGAPPDTVSPPDTAVADTVSPDTVAPPDTVVAPPDTLVSPPDTVGGSGLEPGG